MARARRRRGWRGSRLRLEVAGFGGGGELTLDELDGQTGQEPVGEVIVGEQLDDPPVPDAPGLIGGAGERIGGGQLGLGVAQHPFAGDEAVVAGDLAQEQRVGQVRGAPPRSRSALIDSRGKALSFTGRPPFDFPCLKAMGTALRSAPAGQPRGGP